jgi:hypothetical protein
MGSSTIPNQAQRYAKLRSGVFDLSSERGSASQRPEAARRAQLATGLTHLGRGKSIRGPPREEQPINRVATSRAGQARTVSLRTNLGPVLERLTWDSVELCDSGWSIRVAFKGSPDIVPVEAWLGPPSDRVDLALFGAYPDSVEVVRHSLVPRLSTVKLPFLARRFVDRVPAKQGRIVIPLSDQPATGW